MGGDGGGELEAGRLELIGLDHAGDQPHGERLDGEDGPAGEHELGRAATANDTRKQVADPHLSAGQTHLHVGDEKLGVGRRHPHVAAQAEREAATRRGAIDRRHHRDPQRADPPDQFAQPVLAPKEFGDLMGPILGGGAESLLQVSTGTEAAARSGEYDNPARGVGDHAVERGVDILDELAGDGIEAFRPVQREPPDTGLWLVDEDGVHLSGKRGRHGRVRSPRPPLRA